MKKNYYFLLLILILTLNTVYVFSSKDKNSVVTGVAVAAEAVKPEVVEPFQPFLDVTFPQVVLTSTVESTKEDVVKGEDKPTTVTPEKIAIVEEVKKYTVTATKLNVRTESNRYSDIIDVISKGDVVSSKVSENGWLKLTSGGFVKASYLVPYDATKVTAKTDVESVKPVVKKVNVEESSPKSTGGFEYPKINDSVTVASNLTADDIEVIFKGTELAGQGLGEAFVAMEEEYGVNAFFAIAVAKLESGNGKSNIAKKKNNLFGINATGKNEYSNAKTYESKADGVDAFGSLIKRVYLDKDYTTVSKINGKYCPPNADWKNLVVKIMKGDIKKLKK